jgi:hypothetical protein
MNRRRAFLLNRRVQGNSMLGERRSCRLKSGRSRVWSGGQHAIGFVLESGSQDYSSTSR